MKLVRGGVRLLGLAFAGAILHAMLEPAMAEVIRDRGLQRKIQNVVSAYHKGSTVVGAYRVDSAPAHVHFRRLELLKDANDEYPKDLYFDDVDTPGEQRFPHGCIVVYSEGRDGRGQFVFESRPDGSFSVNPIYRELPIDLRRSKEANKSLAIAIDGHFRRPPGSTMVYQVERRLCPQYIHRTAFKFEFYNKEEFSDAKKWRTDKKQRVGDAAPTLTVFVGIGASRRAGNEDYVTRVERAESILALPLSYRDDKVDPASIRSVNVFVRARTECASPTFATATTWDGNMLTFSGGGDPEPLSFEPAVVPVETKRRR